MAKTRIHIEVTDSVHRMVKSAAAWEGITLKQFVIDAITAASEKPAQERADARAARRQAS